MSCSFKELYCTLSFFDNSLQVLFNFIIKKNIPPKAKMQPQLDIRVQGKKILEMQEINSDTTALG